MPFNFELSTVQYLKFSKARYKLYLFSYWHFELGSSLFFSKCIE